jgi:hypothetical protein
MEPLRFVLVDNVADASLHFRARRIGHSLLSEGLGRAQSSHYGRNACAGEERSTADRMISHGVLPICGDGAHFRDYFLGGEHITSTACRTAGLRA